MNKQDKGKYSLTVIEGSGENLTEIQIKRVDVDEFSEDEIEDLLAELEELFPTETYKLSNETRPSEDDVILHVYVSLQQEERLRRSHGALGKRVIVPKSEVEKQLKDWFS
jgi:hypothetical protein